MLLKWVSNLLLFGVSQVSAADSLGAAVVAEGGTPQDISTQDDSGAPPTLAQALPPDSHRIENRTQWKLSCGGCINEANWKDAIDESTKSVWNISAKDNQPLIILVELNEPVNVDALSVLPQQTSGKDGFILTHKIFLSPDGVTWGAQPAAYGTWYADSSEKLAAFEAQLSIKYVRLVVSSNSGGPTLASIANLNIYHAKKVIPPNPKLGAWGPSIDLPVVPVAGAIEPTTGKFLTWSSWSYNAFTSPGPGMTTMARFDPETGEVSYRDISQSHHDMFCPGLAMDGTGEFVVTGGNSEASTTLHNDTSGQWTQGPDMNLPRGYQASATTCDGHVFIVGGSWNGGYDFDRNGESFNPWKQEWEMLDGASVRAMMTDDQKGSYRADSHGWLFGWKDQSVFQAGPSKNMNWYSTKSGGSNFSAGTRADGTDSMSGNAVMFDASKGEILTFGGSPSYDDTEGNSDAFLINLSDKSKGNFWDVGVKRVGGAGGMGKKRVFHTSVVLPDGSTFITGGQKHGVVFQDSTPQLTPQRYIPQNQTFIDQQPNSIVRVYHSLSLLLPDATVINAGGGLCGSCNTNHFDGQIFTPPYLLTGAPRPAISSISASTPMNGTVLPVDLGETITINTNTTIDQTVALVRYGTATHTVNTDQRRIPLNVTSSGGSNKFTIRVPGDPGVAIPGYWMLFVFKGGVPSVAKTIRIKAPQTCAPVAGESQNQTAVKFRT
ncbi:hypothetical protein N7504_011436 [Penicillium tannophilum]|nr:hypothetical protein N7504_011436 [Penicillium tannophilum]